MLVDELSHADLEEGFRSWEGARQMISVPVDRTEVGMTAGERIRGRFDPVFERVYQKLYVAFAPRGPVVDWFPVRLWLPPKDLCAAPDTPLADQLIQLWHRHGYRPLTLHQALDLETALESSALTELQRTRLYPRVPLGMQASYRVDKKANEWRPVVVQFSRQSQSAGSSTRALCIDFVDSFDGSDVLFPLTFDLSREERAACMGLQSDAPALHQVPARLRPPPR